MKRNFYKNFEVSENAKSDETKEIGVNKKWKMAKTFLRALAASLCLAIIVSCGGGGKKVDDWSSFVAAYKAGTEDIVLSKSIIADSFMELGKTNGNNFMINGKKHTLDGNSKDDLGFVFYDEADIRFDVKFKNIEFANFKKRDAGGAIYAYATTLAFSDNISFTNNTARLGGGALHITVVTDVSFTKAKVSFTGNTTNKDGGAILIDGAASIAFKDSQASFIGNSARGDGGAIEVKGESGMTFTNSPISFEGNSANYGAAICVDFDSEISFTNSQVSFTGNKTKENGGAVEVYDRSRLSFDGSPVSFTNNSTNGSGGAVYVRIGSNISFSNMSVSFIGNTADKNGGAIILRDASKLSFTNAQITFKDNRATGILNDVYFFDAKSTLVFSGNNTLTDGIRTNGSNAIISIEKDASLTLGGDSNINNYVHNYGKMILESGNSKILYVGVVSGGILYLKNVELTVNYLHLLKGSTLNIEIDFKKQTAPVLFLTGKTTFEQGVKLEINNLTPNASQAKVLIISTNNSFNWKNFIQNVIYDADKYELSFENGKVYITNKR